MLAVALYLEKSKYIRKITMNPYGSPQHAEQIIISPYDYIRQHVGFRKTLLGDKIALVADDFSAEIRVIATGFDVDNIINLENIDLDTTFKDIFVNNEPLLNYLDECVVLL
jgi:hypothetical protein